jgi:transposase InsO family protein
VHRERRARGVRVGKERVERLMRAEGLRARQKRRFRRTTDSKHGLPVAPNVLARSFEPTGPNRAWVTDVTYVATDEGRAGGFKRSSQHLEREASRWVQGSVDRQIVRDVRRCDRRVVRRQDGGSTGSVSGARSLAA